MARRRRVRTRAWGRPGTFSRARSLRDQLETDDTAQDQADAYQPQRRRRLSEQVDAERGGTDCPDPGPHRVSGPDRQRLEREPEQDDAQNHADDSPHRRQQACEAVGVFQADRPADLEQAGDGQIDPRHDVSPGVRGKSLREGRSYCSIGAASDARTPGASSTKAAAARMNAKPMMS